MQIRGGGMDEMYKKNGENLIMRRYYRVLLGGSNQACYPAIAFFSQRGYKD